MIPMMSETSAGHTSHETTTSTGTTTGTSSSSLTSKPEKGLTRLQLYAINYKTAIAASIGAAVSAVVGYFRPPLL